MKKSVYIDLMELVMTAYTDEHIKSYSETAFKNGIEEHGYPRLTANLGILIAHGRKIEYRDYFHKMMDFCCKELPTSYFRNGHRVGNDFSVKEIVFCLLELEKAGVFDKSVTDGWREDLAKIDPYRTYSVIASRPPMRINNWAAFGAVSEQLRKYAGIGDESFFIENQVASQLFSFDENGMYRDPNEPMVYDTVTRLQLALALYFGFDGKSKEPLEEQLLKSADITLQLQSVTGEIAYGGRSAQFLHNEAHFAALCEFYACMFKKQGNLRKAEKFKKAAAIAVGNIIPWLKEDTIHHVKNYYPQDSMIGCENYAYFDKYMVTAGSMLYAAYVMADDDIEEADETVENGVYETGPYFHKVVCRFGDYLAQFDTAAFYHYDASGLGRIHKKGAPSAICLSTSVGQHLNYATDVENPSPFSICAGVKMGDKFEYTYEESSEYTLVGETVTDKFVRANFECRTESGKVIKETCTVSDDGVEITASGDGELEILFPLFMFDGLNHTEISVSEKTATVLYKGYKCAYRTNGTIAEKASVYANRNGHFKVAAATGKNSVTLNISIDKI